MARFTYEEIEKAMDTIDPIFLRSPQFECVALGDLTCARVILKLETENPIRSFKGRGGDLLTQRATDKELMCASAGNFGQAMALCCTRRGIKLTVYASVHANPFKVQRMKEFGATVVQQGEDFDTSKNLAREEARRRGVRFIEDSLDIETVIGAGTIGIELSECSIRPDVILVPLGNGALINGISVASKRLMPGTRVIAIQSANAPAMIESWKSGGVVAHEKVTTIADGIGVRIPVVEALNEMRPLIDGGYLVKEDTIIKAMQLLKLHGGVMVEPSAAVGLAAMIENPELFANNSVALILTGGNLTEEQVKLWFN
jgi:threonine dehydratase